MSSQTIEIVLQFSAWKVELSGYRTLTKAALFTHSLFNGRAEWLNAALKTTPLGTTRHSHLNVSQNSSLWPIKLSPLMETENSPWGALRCGWTWKIFAGFLSVAPVRRTQQMMMKNAAGGSVFVRELLCTKVVIRNHSDRTEVHRLP